MQSVYASDGVRCKYACLHICIHAIYVVHVCACMHAIVCAVHVSAHVCDGICVCMRAICMIYIYIYIYIGNLLDIHWLPRPPPCQGEVCQCHQYQHYYPLCCPLVHEIHRHPFCDSQWNAMRSPSLKTKLNGCESEATCTRMVQQHMSLTRGLLMADASHLHQSTQ